MDRRSWPWKKKSSEKTVIAIDTHNASLASSGDTKTNQDDTKSVHYVQISTESYAHLTGLEDKVKTLNEEVSDLNEKLSSAQSEMLTKATLVKQHAKVAEEAVSGWEKAEAEALALKQQLESVTLLKLSVEDRASHLDGALKECMKQVWNVKEEGEQKLHDVVFAKTKQWEKAKAELEARIADFGQVLLKSSADNTALSRALQERSDLLLKINDEKADANAEIEVLKNDIQSCEREINSLKYELHVVSKELEIRNEEKNMSMRSAEVANKQHLEDIKKITKLEGECQRLRGLVRKKLPGPAALAQMKVEVESLGRDYGETRLRRAPARSSSPHGFAFENMQQCHKENGFLTAHMLNMEEEMKMLKEALSKRNSELQASRNMCSKTANKLRSIEAHFLGMNQNKSLANPITEIPFDIGSNPPSLTSMSEDGIDEEGSCSESPATAMISELSQFKKEKNVEKSNKANNSNQLELMDDFLEMEKLACLSTEAENKITVSDVPVDNLKTDSDINKKDENPPADELESIKSQLTLSKLQSRIACLFESQSQDANMRKLLEDMRRIVQDADEELTQHSSGPVANENHSDGGSSMQKEFDEHTGEVSERGVILKRDVDHDMDQDLRNAISQIHDLVVSIGNDAKKDQGRSDDDSWLSERIEEFSTSFNKVLFNEVSMRDFLLTLSHILSGKSFLNHIMPSYKCNEGESYNSDCIDKVTLLENKVAPNVHTKENFAGTCILDSHSPSEPDIDSPIRFELKTALEKCSLEDFEQLKLQKENMETDLASCKEMLELANHQLVEMEQHISDLKSQLVASEKSNSLAETQLKCMAESYKSLESQKQGLETQVNMLHTKVEMLEKELQQENTKVEMLEKEIQEEKISHQDDLAKFEELQEQIERDGKCSVCSVPSDADVDSKVMQERELAAAAEKLAECQETIFLLGKQLNSLRPLSESIASSPNSTQHLKDRNLEDEPSGGMLSPQHLDRAELENITTIALKTSDESPLNGHIESGLFPSSPLNSTPSKHRSSKSSSYSSSSNTVSEKHGRRISRFFSKGRNEH